MPDLNNLRIKAINFEEIDSLKNSMKFFSKIMTNSNDFTLISSKNNEFYFYSSLEVYEEAPVFFFILSLI